MNRPTVVAALVAATMTLTTTAAHAWGYDPHNGVPSLTFRAYNQPGPNMVHAYDWICTEANGSYYVDVDWTRTGRANTLLSVGRDECRGGGEAAWFLAGNIARVKPCKSDGTTGRWTCGRWRAVGTR